MLNRILFAVVLPPSVTVGRDVVFEYSGLGIAVHARCQIGDRVRIGQNVTPGGRAGHYAVPIVEDDVEIGSGAKVLGPVRPGRGCRIGANAVGVPARVLQRAE